MFGLTILAALTLLLLATVPYYPYSRGWGYGPAGFVAIAAIVWLVLIYAGMVALPWAGGDVAPGGAP